MPTPAPTRWLATIPLVSVLLLAACTAPAESAPTATPTPTVEPPQPVDLPRVATARAGVNDWALADGTTLAAVLPEVGDAADGAVALRVDAPVVDAPIAAARVGLAAAAGDTLTVEFQARALTPLPGAVPASVTVAGQRVVLPELDAEWTTVEAEVEVPAEATEAALEIVVDAAVTGLSFDDFVVTGAGDGNLVPNGSFEATSATAGIVSDSLIMNADTASVAIALAPGAASWSARRGEEVVASGEANLAGALAGIPLDGIEQGYFDFTVTDSAGASITTPIVVVAGDGYGIQTDPRFGVGMHVENDIYTGAARYAASLGIAEGRNDILWRHNETVKGQYDWAPNYVREFTRMHVNGVKVMGIVNYGNALYGNKNTPDTPEALAAYGRYAAAIAQRFDLVGLEVFNEFNHERFNKTGCGTAPACYIPLLQTVHDNVRAVDPDLPLVAGSTANYDAAWFDGLWQAGGMNYADAMSYHPYQIVPDPAGLAGIIATSRDSMQAYGGGTLPIWITELGSTSTGGMPSQLEQAEFAFKASITAFGNGVEKFFWYDLINDSPDPTVHEGNFGLFGQPISGVTALPPKPVAMTVALVITHLADHEAAAAEPLSADVLSYAFGDGEERTTFAWAPAGATTVQMPVTGDVEVTAVSGQVTLVSPVDGVASVPVSEEGVVVRVLP
ncbi:glycosyl hydrolase [uncultured Microbacterium sp.]|uniref:glycosyl hydrolase n=1 Tax=uncultured Microbacterium sp. TaxID=191216 RepID=UPI00261CDB0F|nr:glycosyl hydrolase [uncultured Microbacterium sp.]